MHIVVTSQLLWILYWSMEPDHRGSGDVSPISMSPISQSQFIPLGEILCLAISAMNSARKQVTQEALMEHLTTCFP
ncbi:PREDICTED: storkhead-box protein 2-like, partial [Merops nubicus]